MYLINTKLRITSFVQVARRLDWASSSQGLAHSSISTPNSNMSAPYTGKRGVKLAFFLVAIRNGVVVAWLRKNEIEKGIEKWKYT